MVCERLCQSMTNRAPRSRDTYKHRREGRWILDEEHVGLGDAQQGKEESQPLGDAATCRAEHEAAHATLAAAGERSIWQPVHVNARVRLDRRHDGRAFKPDQIDVARRRERECVVLHPRAAAEISDYDNCGSH